MQRYLEVKPKPKAKPDVDRSIAGLLITDQAKVMGYIEPKCCKCQQVIRQAASYYTLSGEYEGIEFRAYFHKPCFRALREMGLIVEFREVKD